MIAKRQRRQAARMGVLLRVERELWRSGLTRVAGVDEVGVGPLAGPVVAAAVIVPPNTKLRGVDDSKLLTATLREELAAKIQAAAVGIGIGIVDVADIDRLNIYHAALEAMRRAVEALPVPPEHIVVDARQIPNVTVPQTPLIDGDARCYSVAAASIVAKVARDRLMRELHELYPQYGFRENMGYGTPRHLAAVEQYGPSPVHRRSFAPVRELWLPGMRVSDRQYG
ncbi:MAG TPA: ribonuclease HII [Candidatus Margulisiibacteriota bacterium]|nr:ribonuclease HII [Candidatus Margulisiibacteriota bacterium]